MAICEMCGKDTELVSAIVEGTEMKVCGDCGKFGRVLKPAVLPRKVARPTTSGPEIVQEIIGNYGSKIKSARERLKLTQEELANKINIKTSLIHTFESEHREPQIENARKLERFLNIKLVEEIEVQENHGTVSDSGSLTIGDMLKK